MRDGLSGEKLRMMYDEGGERERMILMAADIQKQWLQK